MEKSVTYVPGLKCYPCSRTFDVSFGAAAYTATENGTAATVTVTLSQTPLQQLQIPISTTPTTGPFTLSANSVTFAQGATNLSQTFTVTANDDTDASDETVDLSFGTLPTGVTAVSPSTATVTLQDDDPPTVTITGPTESVSSTFTATITFSEPVGAQGTNVSRDFSRSDISVTNGSKGTLTATNTRGDTPRSGRCRSRRSWMAR